MGVIRRRRDSEEERLKFLLIEKKTSENTEIQREFLW